MIPLVYHPGYNITACGVERLHPFDSTKYRRIHDELIRQGIRRSGDFHRPSHCTQSELELLHDAAYLRSLRQSLQLAKILEVSLIAMLPAVFTRWRVLRPMLLAMGGTILACRLALEHGAAINLGGGFHHANGSHGHGFCVYADAPTALAVLHGEEKIRSALVIDTDAHQGDGTADAVRSWSWAHVLDFFDRTIFPMPKVEEAVPVPLPGCTGGDEYLRLLDEHLPRALDRFRPEFIVYNAGSDVLATDPLSSLQLAPAHLAERDLRVLTAARERRIPIAMVLSGGYGPLSWQAHASSIKGILSRFDNI